MQVLPKESGILVEVIEMIVLHFLGHCGVAVHALLLHLASGPFPAFAGRPAHIVDRSDL